MKMGGYDTLDSRDSEGQNESEKRMRRRGGRTPKVISEVSMTESHTDRATSETKCGVCKAEVRVITS